MAWFYCECTKNIEHHTHICTLKKESDYILTCDKRLHKRTCDFFSGTFLRLIDLVSLQKHNFNNRVIDIKVNKIVFEGKRDELLKLNNIESWFDNITNWFIREYEFKVENNKLIFEVTISSY